MKTHYVVLMVVAALALGAVGGMQYEKSVAAKAPANARSFAAGSRGGSGVANQSGQQGMLRGGANGGGFVMGEVLSSDDKSLTVKTADGGSTIVYFSPTMSVRKAEAGTLSDLAVGQQVVVNGKSSTDGTLSADTISIAPSGSK